MLKMLGPKCQARFINVPYKGGSQAIMDLLAGNIDMFIGSYSVTAGYVEAGTLKITAEIGNTRSRLYPDVPMFKFELYKKLPNPVSWYLFATKNTDTKEIEQALETVYATSEWQQYLQKSAMGRNITANSAAEQFYTDSAKLAKIMQKAQNNATK